MSIADIDRASAWFAQRGHAAVLLGRLVPGIRTLISVPAGVVGMPLLPFLATSAVGTFFWTGLLAAAGYQLGERNGRPGAGSSRSGTVFSSEQ